MEDDENQNYCAVLMKVKLPAGRIIIINLWIRTFFCGENNNLIEYEFFMKEMNNLSLMLCYNNLNLDYPQKLPITTIEKKNGLSNDQIKELQLMVDKKVTVLLVQLPSTLCSLSNDI